MLLKLGTAKRVFLVAPPTTGLAGVTIGDAHVVPENEGTVSDFSIVDTFDGQIMAAGHMLVATEAGVMLLTADGACLTQNPAEPGFVHTLPAGPITTRLTGVVDPLRRLIPLADGKVTVQDTRMVDDLEKTVARSRYWQFETDAARVAMVDFTPIRGYDAELSQLETCVRALGETLDQPGAVGQTLIGPERLYVSKPHIVMTPDESAFDVANHFLQANLEVARRNEPGVIADLDSEFLHDYRVALRRIRSVLSLFKGVYAPAQTEKLKARFSALMAPTGRLRDLDVYLLERDRYVALLPAQFQPGLVQLFDTIAADRQAVLDALADTFRSDAYLAEVAALQGLLASPKRMKQGPEAHHTAFDYAQRLIWKRYRKVCKIAVTIDDDTPDAQVHELRIQCKKLRYLIEFFAPLFEKSGTKTVVKSLKNLQNTLGAFNDYSVQQVEMIRMLDAINPRRTKGALACAASIGALVTLLNQKQLQERSHVVSKFNAFDAPDTRDLMRALFKPGKIQA